MKAPRWTRRGAIELRWTGECTALLEELNAQGLTDTEIARAIEERTGLRFSRRWIRRQRHMKQIGSSWRSWEKREKPAGWKRPRSPG